MLRFWERLADSGDRHADAGAILITCAGILYRFRVAAESFLNPEEAFHSMLSASGDFQSLLRTPIIDTHPPLLFFVLRLFQTISYSEVVMRAPIVLAGGLLPWFVYLWVGRIRGKAAGLIALSILVISPNLFELSIQLRGFILTVFFTVVALYCLQRALDQNSVKWMVLFPIPLYLAVATEYMAVFVCCALGVYYLIARREVQLSRSVELAWLGGQAGLFAVCVGLEALRMTVRPSGEYLSHPIEYLKGLYWEGTENPAVFLATRTYDVFSYIFSLPGFAFVGIAGFGFGLWFLWTGRPWPDGRPRRSVAVLLLTPFVLGAAAALANVHPYGWSRHSIYLAPFLAAGAGIGLEWAFRRRVALICLAVMAAGPVWFVLGYRDSVVMPRLRKLKTPLEQALTYVRKNVPEGAVILTDNETGMVLSHYLDPAAKWPRGHNRGEVSAGGYLLYCPRWTFEGFDSVREDLATLREQGVVGAGVPVWVVDSGFHTPTRLEWLADPKMRKELSGAREFGLGTFIFEAPPGFETGISVQSDVRGARSLSR